MIPEQDSSIGENTQLLHQTQSIKQRFQRSKSNSPQNDGLATSSIGDKLRQVGRQRTRMYELVTGEVLKFLRGGAAP